MLRLLLIACVVACGGGAKSTTTTTTPPPAAERILVHTDDQGVGLGGNDPISYTTAAVAPGTAEHTSTHGGAVYRFATPETKQTFDADPAKYAPAFGGYCAYAASQNRLSPSDPAAYLVHEGQLLMFTNDEFRELFQQDPAGNKQKADANWPGLVAKHGKPR